MLESKLKQYNTAFTDKNLFLFIWLQEVLDFVQLSVLYGAFLKIMILRW